MRRLVTQGILIFSIVALIFSAYTIVFEYYPLLSAGRAYRQGNFDEAIKKYRYALWMHPDSDVLNFNIGAALYRKGDYRQAAEFFSKVAASKDNDLRQKSQYNSGNCWYILGRKEEDVNTAGSLYRKSLDHYDQALEFNANDEDAKYNKKVAAKMLEEAFGRASASDRRKSGNDDPWGQDNKQPQNPQGQNDSAGHRNAGRQGVQKTEKADDLKEKSAEQGKERGPIPFKRGEMSREDAEMLLEEFRKKEQSGSTQVDTAKRGHDQEVEKNW